MGLISSRLNLGSLRSANRSQQDENLYTYSLSKNYFSNYFLMGGERFEVKDPEYLFGDNCDLNFLSCTKPNSLPYKQAQQNILSNLGSRQKSTTKVASRTSNRFGSSINLLTGRHRRQDTLSKQEVQSLKSTHSLSHDPEPSQPLIMLVNIRKETLRLTKCNANPSLDCDINSLNNSDSTPSSATEVKGIIRLIRKRSLPKRSMPRSGSSSQCANSLAATSNQATSAVTRLRDNSNSSKDQDTDKIARNSQNKPIESDAGSLHSATSSIKSGYKSIREYTTAHSRSSDCDDDVGQDNGHTETHSNDDDEEQEEFKDALNVDPSSISIKAYDEEDCACDGSSQDEKHEDIPGGIDHFTQTKENRDTNITILPSNESATYTINPQPDSYCLDERIHQHKNRTSKSGSSRSRNEQDFPNTDRVYNLQFEFDTEVDCTIRIFYFCTREITSRGVNYKPQHAAYRSKIYPYKKGLNQKFDQVEHTFQPFLFDEDLLIYKPLDSDGNYNSGAVFPIVIHIAASEGPLPRQCQSLIATIEKSSLDDSYSIKPLKQLIFVDGVQYILQDIYGIENRRLLESTTTDGNTIKGKWNNRNHDKRRRKSSNQAQTRMSDLGIDSHGIDGESSRNVQGLRDKSHSIQSELNKTYQDSYSHISDSASVASVNVIADERGTEDQVIVDMEQSSHQSETALDQIESSNPKQKQTTCDNTFECVICMSESRDTMLLPCRHLCLCGSCAQSLRYQASTCPICRCPFKAALNLRPTQGRQ